MIAFVMMVAIADTELATLRAESSRTAWSMCIDNQLKKFENGTGEPRMSKPALVQLAMQRCYVFGKDFKETLPDLAEGHLKSKGVQHYSQGVVDTIADEAFRQAEEQMRKAKEGQ